MAVLDSPVLSGIKNYAGDAVTNPKASAVMDDDQ